MSERPSKSLNLMTPSNRLFLRRAQIRSDSYGGHGLFATCNISSGDIVLIEDPLIVSSTDMVGMFNRFGRLTSRELKVLDSVEAHVDSVSDADKNTIRNLSNDEEIVNAFLWFVAVMKCNAHGISAALTNKSAHISSQIQPSRSQSLWGIFPMGLRANHSCDPNISYRSLSGSRLCYLANRPIQCNEEITMSYIDCIFTSRSFRQERLREQKLFVCKCERCSRPEDSSRRIFCPHCRKDDPESEFNGELSKDRSPDPTTKNRPIAYIQYMDVNMWFCPRCELTFDDSVIPLVVETTLYRLFNQLDLNFAKPTSEAWLNCLVYLFKTSKQVLGSLHWLTAGCHFLFSRYFLSSWYGGGKSAATVSRAILHAEEFFDFIGVRHD